MELLTFVISVGGLTLAIVVFAVLPFLMLLMIAELGLAKTLGMWTHVAAWIYYGGATRDFRRAINNSRFEVANAIEEERTSAAVAEKQIGNLSLQEKKNK